MSRSFSTVRVSSIGGSTQDFQVDFSPFTAGGSQRVTIVIYERGNPNNIIYQRVVSYFGYPGGCFAKKTLIGRFRSLPIILMILLLCKLQCMYSSLLFSLASTVDQIYLWLVFTKFEAFFLHNVTLTLKCVLHGSRQLELELERTRLFCRTQT